MSIVLGTIQLAYETLSDLTAWNGISLAGQVSIVKDSANDSVKLKIGDGLTAWNALPFFSPGGSVNPTSGVIPINSSGSLIDSFLSQDTNNLLIADGKKFTSLDGKSILDFSSGAEVSISSTDIFSNSSSIVVSPEQINFNSAIYNMANITPDSYLYIDSSGNLTAGTAPLTSAPSLASVISSGGAMAGLPITSPDSLSTFIITNLAAQLDWTEGISQGQLYFNATNLGFAWSDGTESAAFNANATQLEIVHSESMIVNAPIVNIGTQVDNTVINYGNSSTIHNFLGSALYEYQANQYVLDKLITLNYGGATASGIGVGFEIEENSVITGYLKTNGARTGFSFLAPANSNSTDFVFTSTTAKTKTFQDTTSTIAEYANKLSVFAATSSAELAGVISDETGYSSGALLVFSKSPVIDAPTISGIINASSMTASSIVETDASKNFISVSKNTAYNKNFGTASNTVTEGNDARLSDSRYKKIFAYQNTDSSHTGSTSETILCNLSIPLNSMGANDVMMIESSLYAIGTAGSKIFRAYIGPNSNSLTGAVQCGLVQMAAANVWSALIRKIANKNSQTTNNVGLAATNSITENVTTSTARTATNIDFTVQQYFMITVVLGSSADTAGIDNVQLSIGKG